MDSVDISIVIPVYNSAAMLPALHGRLQRVLADMEKSYEVILVDDGSQDESWSVMRQLQHVDPAHVVSVQLMRNFGQHNALMCGFRLRAGNSSSPWTMTCSIRPRRFPSCCRPSNPAISTWCTAPTTTSNTAGRRTWRRKSSTCFIASCFARASPSAQFRIVRRELLETILSYTLNFTFIDGLLAWNTRRAAEVIVAHHSRAAGRSGYRLGKLLTLALNLFTNFSLLPLQWVSLTGLLAALADLPSGCTTSIST